MIVLRVYSELNQEKLLQWRNSAHSDLGLTECLLVVKARLKPANNYRE